MIRRTCLPSTLRLIHRSSTNRPLRQGKLSQGGRKDSPRCTMADLVFQHHGSGCRAAMPLSNKTESCRRPSMRSSVAQRLKRVSTRPPVARTRSRSTEISRMPRSRAGWPTRQGSPPAIPVKRSPSDGVFPPAHCCVPSGFIDRGFEGARGTLPNDCRGESAACERQADQPGCSGLARARNMIGKAVVHGAETSASPMGKRRRQSPDKPQLPISIVALLRSDLAGQDEW
jgi:hypothetical protein